MTDNEIIKALECCTGIRKIDACAECPAYVGCNDCVDILREESLGLINRQNAEIERLRKELNTDFVFLGRTGKSQKASQLIRVKVNAIRAEAIKEFAERLKEHSSRIQIGDKYDSQIVTINGIDYLVKEMVGDAE